MAYKKNGLQLVQREFNKESGKYDCVWRDGGSIVKTQGLPLTFEDSVRVPGHITLESFRLHLRSIHSCT